MKQSIEAIYENGVFRPLKTPKLSEGQEVELIIYSKNQLNPSQMLQLAAEVYQGFSDEEIRDIEQIATERTNFFSEATD